MLSTKSFASFRPAPVSSRYCLIAPILLPPPDEIENGGRGYAADRPDRRRRAGGAAVTAAGSPHCGRANRSCVPYRPAARGVVRRPCRCPPPWSCPPRLGRRYAGACRGDRRGHLRSGSRLVRRRARRQMPSSSYWRPAGVGGKLRLAEIAGAAPSTSAPRRCSPAGRRAVDLAIAAGLADSLIAPLTTSARSVRAGGTAPASGPDDARHPGRPRRAARIAAVLSAAGLAEVEAEADRARARSRLPTTSPSGRWCVSGWAPRLSTSWSSRCSAACTPAGRTSCRCTPRCLRWRHGWPRAAVASRLGARRHRCRRVAHRPMQPVFHVAVRRPRPAARALAGSGRFAVRTGVTVRAIRRTATGLRPRLRPGPRCRN